MFEDFKNKDSVVVVYTGEGKGKTSASLGTTVRALGSDWRVAYVQFIKVWDVGEHKFLKKMQEIYKGKLSFYKGGKGFYRAGGLSAKNVTLAEHKQAAQKTLAKAIQYSQSGKHDLVVCDEINNAAHDGLIKVSDLKSLITGRNNKTSICLTGRNFPESLLKYADIVTNMTKIKHHYDDKFLAKKGIDY